ncbi:ankyrin repeat and zinc finger domain-containing protein 1 isoform X4 [Silurus asotus]|uniref:Ankyrin repeat and zinc finger domain-containing protein 1 isoform X4 n=1 Tax=Silurus asotus TaxID=30991 RepID=A0AAD5FI69_SILAS|nr:ankyrin repeat and zinc finger domain-containing protein 1 isoform X4 [Silurus asotus]
MAIISRERKENCISDVEEKETRVSSNYKFHECAAFTMARPDCCSLFDPAFNPKLTDGLKEISQLQDLQEPLHLSIREEFPDDKRGTDRTGDELVSPGEVSDRKFCSACQCSFDSREEQMEHYKLDWHRFNLRQRIAGRSPVTVEEFEKKTGMDEVCVSWEFGIQDALYTACKTGDTEALHTLLQQKKDTLIPLLNTAIDSAGYTLLHVASAAAQKYAVMLLLEMGSDPTCRDRKGQTPYAVAPDKECRNMFRKFMAEHPDKYDYAKAQVPGPLTAEIESKKAEKKKAQKAAKKQREKERREEKRKEEEEQEEKRRFLALSEREKRALVAERRLAEQVAKNGGTITNIR